MSKVVPFPTLPHVSTDQEERSSEAGRLAAQRRELARRARETMESRPNLRRADERAVVARNLWDILSRVERERGITKAAVLQAARQGSEGDSTKRLPRFALRPGLTDEERQRRTLKLTKGVKKYARIVAAAARLGRLSEDECLLDLLAGTSYGPNDDDPPDVEPWCETLAGLLNALGRAVALDHDLAGYFSFIGKHALRARDRWDGFEHGMSNDPTPFDLSDGGTTELEECRLLPKVYIDDSTVRRGIRAELVPNPVPEPTGKDSWQTRSKIHGLPADGRPFEGVDAIPATVIIERRLWLCLAPIGVGREVVPAFLERRCFSVL